MIRFRQKEYTIQEGHYTGPKDLESVPSALNVIGKSTLAGMGIGALVGSVLKDTTVGKGAKVGGKTGFVAGILMKVLLNMLHNPMTTVKYQEVDKLIRREFGIFRVSGVTVGDSMEKRGKLGDKFAFNDRDISSFKINVTIQDNNVTMYTLGLSDKELTQLSDSLDYYCKKYYGMEYSSRVINSKDNSYSVAIVFTNYQIISNFLMEISDLLGTKINLLDNKALVDVKITEKEFSEIEFDKYDVFKILVRGGVRSIDKFRELGIKKGISGLILGSFLEAFYTMSERERAKISGLSAKKSSFDNSYLTYLMEYLRYIENVNYTVGIPGSPLNIYLDSGLLMICAALNSKECSKLEKIYKELGLNRTEIKGKAILYTYQLDTRENLSKIIKKLVNSGLTPNIYKK